MSSNQSETQIEIARIAIPNEISRKSGGVYSREGVNHVVLPFDRLLLDFRSSVGVAGQTFAYRTSAEWRWRWR